MRILFPTAKKITSREIISPQAQLAQFARGAELPSRAVFCPLGVLTKYALSQGRYQTQRLLADVYVDKQHDFCFTAPGICGAPAAALQLEMMIAAGVKKCIFIGTAGSLQEELQPADLMLCQEAVCADGTSPHYTLQEMVRPHAGLFKAFFHTLQQEPLPFHTGRHWSTDAVLRETRAQVRHYQKHAVLSVDMEAAAFLAVCRRRRVQGAAAFVISDLLYSGTWRPSFGNKEINRQLCRLFGCARKTLLQAS